MRFTQFYSGSTVCAPSRCSLLTGLHTGHARVRGNGKTTLTGDDVTVGKLLRDAGYATGCFGKWGLGDQGSTGIPNQQGFESFYGFLNHNHAHNYWPDHLFRNDDKVPLRNTLKAPNVAETRVDYAPDFCTAECLKFLDGVREKPFFVYYAPTLPHANNESGRATGNGMEIPDAGIYKEKSWPEPQKNHAAMITRMDADVGKVLAKLAEKGLEKNTFVFFSSDNGPHKEGGADPAFFGSAGGLTGFKRSLTDGGIRVPLIVRGPGVPAGKVGKQVGAFWDIAPTLCELAGVPAGKFDGISLVAMLKGGDVKERSLYWEFHEGGFKQAARIGDWKGIKLHPEEPLKLYNLGDDVAEKNDVAAKNPEAVAKVEAFLKEQRTASDDWPIKPGPRTKN